MTNILKKFPNDPMPVSVIGGERYFLHLEDGKKILDFTGGWTAHNVLGLNDEGLKKSIVTQLGKYPHVDTNLWSNPLLDELATLIIKNAPVGLDKVFFSGCNGSDAIEAAMKLSFHIHHDTGHKTKNKYIYREQSFSGSTLQALCVSDIPIFNFYEPLKPSGYIKISEHNYLRFHKHDESEQDYVERCAKELENTILKNGPENIAAFVGETMLGSLRGDIPPATGYWKKIKAICEKYDIHLILDEIYCGMGRSGKVFCCTYDEITPDFICIGKGAAGGYAPVSAVITKSKYEEIIGLGSGRIQLGHTFSGYALGAAAMFETQKRVQTDEMLNHVSKMGSLIRKYIDSELGDHEFYLETRGRGLNTAFEYKCDNQHGFSLELQRRMMNKHSILINAKWHRTTFTPAFIITEEDVEKVIDLYCSEFKDISKNWTGISDSASMLPRSHGGKAPGA